MRMYTSLRTFQRVVRAAFWLMIACVVIPSIFLLPRSAPWRPSFREASVGFFCRRIYQVLNVKVTFMGEIATAPALLAPNHVSWLDVVILGGYKPLAFIAKADVENWPLIGWLCRKANALFIHRENKFRVYRESLPAAQRALQAGQSLVVFAEGTTANTEQISHFYPMFFEAALREQAKVQAIAIRYLTASGERSRDAAFIDDDGFVQSLLRIAAADVTYAEIHFCQPLACSHRKQYAQQCRQQINQVLLSAPDTPQSNRNLYYAGQ